MHPFEFIRPKDSAGAVAAAARAKTAQQGADVRFLAGGTTLLDLMKLNVETPSQVIDVNRLPLDKIEATRDGGLKIGATARNSDLAHHPTVRRDHSVLSQATKAACMGCKASGVPRPSMVVISCPSCSKPRLRQEFTRRPLTCTVQAPHCP